MASGTIYQLLRDYPSIYCYPFKHLQYDRVLKQEQSLSMFLQSTRCTVYIDCSYYKEINKVFGARAYI